MTGDLAADLILAGLLGSLVAHGWYWLKDARRRRKDRRHEAQREEYLRRYRRWKRDPVGPPPRWEDVQP